TFKIMLEVRAAFHRHFTGYPGERDIGLSPAKLLQSRLCHTVVSGHRGGRSQDAMATDEVAALPQCLACKADRLVIVAAGELGIGGDAVIQCREGIARAEPQRPAYSKVSFLPASRIAQRQSVEGLCKRKIRVESQRQFALGDRIVKAPFEQISISQSMVGPR